MPVILNLIKESLKPVTRGADGGHAIALPLSFSCSISLFPNQLVHICHAKKTKKTVSKKRGSSFLYPSQSPSSFV